LTNVAQIAMSPTAKPVEQFDEELKTELADSGASLNKKIDGLRLDELEWQSMLKKAHTKPDAIYKVVNTKDGYLTLTGIAKPEGSATRLGDRLKPGTGRREADFKFG